MGHLRLGTLPTSRKWREVVALLPEPSSTVSEIAAATMEAAKHGVDRAADDAGFIETFWLLTQIPLAAREENFAAALNRIGLKVPDAPAAFDVLAALSDAVERVVTSGRARSDFAELSLAAAQEAVSQLCIEDARGLFEATSADVQNSFRKYSTKAQFSALARLFFKGFTSRYLNGFLSRELSNHVGDTGRFQGVTEHTQFLQALDQHCYQTARIVEDFAGSWFSKTNFERGIDRSSVRGFLHVALQKIADQLRRGDLKDA
jgi:hypothetical protein